MKAKATQIPVDVPKTTLACLAEMFATQTLTMVVQTTNLMEVTLKTGASV